MKFWKHLSLRDWQSSCFSARSKFRRSRLLYYMQFKLFRVCFKQGFKFYFAERTHDSRQTPLPRGNFVLLFCSLDCGCFKLEINLQSAITQTTNPMINPRLLFSPYMTILSKKLPLHISIITLWNLSESHEKRVDCN